MNYLTAAHTEVGVRKKENQDSVLIRVADSECGRVLLGVLGDGMGGLALGEVASALLIRSFRRWFDEELPALLADGLREGAVFDQWGKLLQEADHRLAGYGEERGLRLGTTAAVLLLSEGRFLTANVGDSRIYQRTDRLRPLTKDQTFVQREVDRGHLTPEEAAVHPQRNILLQCVGGGSGLRPDYSAGTYERGSVFMLCCDGLCHEITPEEFRRALNPRRLRDEKTMERQAARLTKLSLKRRETDNLTAALIKVC